MLKAASTIRSADDRVWVLFGVAVAVAIGGARGPYVVQASPTDAAPVRMILCRAVRVFALAHPSLAPVRSVPAGAVVAYTVLSRFDVAASVVSCSHWPCRRRMRRLEFAAFAPPAKLVALLPSSLAPLPRCCRVRPCRTPGRRSSLILPMAARCFAWRRRRADGRGLFIARCTRGVVARAMATIS